ncbi:MAG: lytic transglycosylase domain-containing protein [Rubritepida sp.]|nr:lytic transglycosylase domain-containing protein [Rubritepida sp.]
MSLRAGSWLGLCGAAWLMGAAQAAGPPGWQPAPALALASDAEACRRAIAQVEPRSGLPPGLLGSIALVESGRADPAGGPPRPWPWAWNAAGESHYPPDRATALAEVAALQARGVASIDIGCMQINLRHHPAAFPTLEEAFDPLANVRYGARFLGQLYATHGEWPAAIARYHSGNPVSGQDYARRVALARLGRAWAGGMPMALRLPGLCAPGLTPVLVPRTGRLATRGPPLLRCRRGRA